ncbi:MAG: hypothetical protein KDJ14_13220 [Xanthomonadales bacterium]|nr:hypothetical protein [Xanthomonadales bacterium]
MWALISTLGVLAAIAIVAAGAITLSNAYRQRAERGGHKGILEYLRAIPASDRDKQEAVDLTLQGGVACLLGLLFPPLLLLGAIPLFYGLRKLLYASMGLGLVADDTTPTANPVEDETPPSE